MHSAAYTYSQAQHLRFYYTCRVNFPSVKRLIKSFTVDRNFQRMCHVMIPIQLLDLQLGNYLVPKLIVELGQLRQHFDMFIITLGVKTGCILPKALNSNFALL